MLDRLFALRARGSSVGTELLAGLTTFLTMAYIIIVNPAILAEAGLPHGAAFVATCLAAALGSLLMGLIANYPIALAPGMGLNAYFTYTVVLGQGHPWPVALGAVFLSGVVFLILVATPAREAIIAAIPRGLKLAISAGIGLFLGLIALKNAGIVVASPATLVTLGPLHRPEPLLAVAGLLLMAGLEARRVPGAILIGILATAAAGMALGVSPFGGLVAAPPALAPTWLAMDVGGAFDLGLATIVFAFLFVVLFDNVGTLVGVTHRSGLADAEGRVPGVGRVLVADALAVAGGAMLGTSPTTSYIESAAGIRAGGRTGLTALTVAALFLLALLFSPLAASIPPYATAPALLFVACLMAGGLSGIAWDDVTEAVPAAITALAMPLTFSIAHGIAFGLISFAAIKLLAGRGREVSLTVWILAAAALAHALLGG
ncbi:NCS2 family permease [Phaeospirillum tilakii]|uniref:NCS2 family permease n=1 Tax=Phaeospirillum tilakii TaxID=741673 RepID=A0ABW5CER1_9PROT